MIIGFQLDEILKKPEIISSQAIFGISIVLNELTCSLSLDSYNVLISKLLSYPSTPRKLFSLFNLSQIGGKCRR